MRLGLLGREPADRGPFCYLQLVIPQSQPATKTEHVVGRIHGESDDPTPEKGASFSS